MYWYLPVPVQQYRYPAGGKCMIHPGWPMHQCWPLDQQGKSTSRYWTSKRSADATVLQGGCLRGGKKECALRPEGLGQEGVVRPLRKGPWPMGVSTGTWGLCARTARTSTRTTARPVVSRGRHGGLSRRGLFPREGARGALGPGRHRRGNLTWMWC